MLSSLEIGALNTASIVVVSHPVVLTAEIQSHNVSSSAVARSVPATQAKASASAHGGAGVDASPNDDSDAGADSDADVGAGTGADAQSSSDLRGSTDYDCTTCSCFPLDT